MTTHKRSTDQTAISVSMTRAMVAEIDIRAQALGLNRSQYLQMLARKDLAERGAMIISEDINSAKVDAAEEKIVNYLTKPKRPKKP